MEEKKIKHLANELANEAEKEYHEIMWARHGVEKAYMPAQAKTILEAFARVLARKYGTTNHS